MYFSIIVPVYRVEAYLETCVDSILSQSFYDFELILVDDGSPDRCPAICDSYAARDARVRVLHKQNGGLVSARQAGIRMATGKYVIHVDSDDWVEPGYLEAAHAIAEQSEPDVISFAIRYVYPNRSRADYEPIACGVYQGDALRTLTDNMLLTPDMRHMHYYLWGKAFRREVILPHQLAVDPKIAMGEDVSCLIPTYLNAKSVYISSKIVYSCRCRDDSMSRAFHAEHFEDIALGVRLLRESESQAPEGFASAIDRYCAFMCFVLLASAAQAGDRSAVAATRRLWCEEFTRALRDARFQNITKKSRIAIALLRRKQIGLAYRFLRVCSRIKGN